MIKSNYDIESYIEPHTTYKTLSDKIKLGQLLFNIQKKAFETVDLKVLEDIVKFEKGRNIDRVYYPIPINSEWLTKVFHFEAKFLNIYNMTVFTSRLHGLKIHEQHGRYYVGYTIREKVKLTDHIKGTINSKPQILFVHELMDQLYLIKREQVEITKSDLFEINNIFEEALKRS